MIVFSLLALMLNTSGVAVLRLVRVFRVRCCRRPRREKATGATPPLLLSIQRETEAGEGDEERGFEGEGGKWRRRKRDMAGQDWKSMAEKFFTAPASKNLYLHSAGQVRDH